MVASPESLTTSEPHDVKVVVRKPPVTTKVYFGRFVAGRRQVVVRQNGVTTKLRCLDFNTPTFAWGYHGGATEELAIAILHDYLGSPSLIVESRVLALYRVFVDEIVAEFERDAAWSITEGVVAKWMAAHETASLQRTAAAR